LLRGPRADNLSFVKVPSDFRRLATVHAVIVTALLAGCARGPEFEDLPWAQLGRPSFTGLPEPEFGAASLRETERDWAIARRTIEWARGHALDTVPIGRRMAILGSVFVGTPYAPGTLELRGPEGVVVNLRAFDCVTLVEHVLVLARLVALDDASFLADERQLRRTYRAELARVRYRGGVLAGYPSRLHYFSDWIRDATVKGLVRDVTVELGGIPDGRRIDFMSRNPDAYRQLGEDPGTADAVRRVEAELNRHTRYFIPKDQIADREAGIEDGDIIAAVSALEGLDVAHTGLALRYDGRLYLLHAPLVGDSVEISERPLAKRIQDISSQVGIIVARPQRRGAN
jgi:hypothetical protein